MPWAWPWKVAKMATNTIASQVGACDVFLALIGPEDDLDALVKNLKDADLDEVTLGYTETAAAENVERAVEGCKFPPTSYARPAKSLAP